MLPPESQFKTLNAVWDAYWAVFARLDRFLYFAVIWLAVGAVVVLMVPEILELGVERRMGLERLPPPELLSGLAEVVVMLAASICMSIAWHRWIILGEPLGRVFPERTDILAAYTSRVLVFVLVPLVVSVAAFVWMTRNQSIDGDTSGIDAVAYIATTLIVAALARCLLAFAAAAVGDKALTFRAAWRLTAGQWWPFFIGYLACELPFTLTILWLNDLNAAPADGSVARTPLDYIASVIDVTGDIVCATFLSFAYLHFTSGRPSEREPAQYFS